VYYCDSKEVIVIMSLPEKQNPNNPVVFFDVAVGSTVSCVNLLCNLSSGTML